jgi:hypothetical protein
VDDDSALLKRQGSPDRLISRTDLEVIDLLKHPEALELKRPFRTSPTRTRLRYDAVPSSKLIAVFEVAAADEVLLAPERTLPKDCVSNVALQLRCQAIAVVNALRGPDRVELVAVHGPVGESAADRAPVDARSLGRIAELEEEFPEGSSRWLARCRIEVLHPLPNLGDSGSYFSEFLLVIPRCSAAPTFETASLSY